MWIITEKQYTNEEGEEYTGYGVSQGKCTVDDITVSLPEITRLVETLNRYEASPVHIYDIIENFFAETC